MQNQLVSNFYPISDFNSQVEHNDALKESLKQLWKEDQPQQDIVIKIFKKTFSFLIADIKKVDTERLEALTKEEAATQMDVVIEAIDEIMGYLHSTIERIEESLVPAKRTEDPKSFACLIAMDFVSKSEIKENFVQIAISLIQMLKFIIKTNMPVIELIAKGESGVEFLSQAEELFRIIERLSLILASPRIYVLLMSLFVGENRLFFETVELGSELPEPFQRDQLKQYPRLYSQQLSLEDMLAHPKSSFSRKIEDPEAKTLEYKKNLISSLCIQDDVILHEYVPCGTDCDYSTAPYAIQSFRKDPYFDKIDVIKTD